jgi:hypothetical protein
MNAYLVVMVAAKDALLEITDCLKLRSPFI